MKQLVSTHLLQKLRTRKKLFIAFFFAAACCIASSQSSRAQSFEKGSNILNVGIGVGTTVYSSGYSSAFPPISVSYEHGIANGRWGIGGFLARTGARYGDKDNYWKYSYTIVGVRGDYHFYMTDKLDTYGGVMLGYDIVSDKWHGEGEGENFSASGSDASFSIFVGGRYYFSDHIGAFAELGYGVAWLNLGLAFKL